MVYDEELTVLACHHCGYFNRHREMDRCVRCDGTGSVFWVSGRSYPNTPKGYDAAVKAKKTAEQSLAREMIP
jgi:hypothetical protein